MSISSTHGNVSWQRRLIRSRMTDILRDISVKQENGDNVSWCRSVGHPRRAQRGRMNWVRPVEQASCPYCLSRLARIRRSVAKRKKWNCVWRRSWHWRSRADDVTYLLERLLRSDVVGRKSGWLGQVHYCAATTAATKYEACDAATHVITPPPTPPIGKQSLCLSVRDHISGTVFIKMLL